MPATALPLYPIADINYSVAPSSQAITGLNTGLILTNESVISPTTRVATYSNLAAMLTAGFSNTGPAYEAATLYFEATSNPTQVAIGRQASGESILTAFTACRNANTQWYQGYAPQAGNSDHSAVAAYVQVVTAPYTQYIMGTNASAVLNNTTGNIFASLNAASYTRTHGMYSNTTYAPAAVMGYAMGQTTIAQNSSYTLFGKTLPGVTPENLTTVSSQQVMNIETNNGNLYLTRGGITSYNLYEKGINFGGTFFDITAGLDLLVSIIQNDIMALLTSVPKIAQTENGMAQLRSVVANDCQQAVGWGLLAPGTWTGAPLYGVATGSTLSSGYVVLSDPIATQSPTNRANRIAPNMYALVKLAGAIQSVSLQIFVNQ